MKECRSPQSGNNDNESPNNPGMSEIILQALKKWDAEGKIHRRKI